jgi:segregation and condensation protein B
VNQRRGRLKKALVEAEVILDDGIDEESTAPAETEVRDNVTVHPETNQHLRILEALLFAAAEPLDEETLASRLPTGVDVKGLIEQLRQMYEKRGINLVQIAGKWAFRTATDLAFLMRREAVEQKRLSRAAMETLAIVAYHQPVTRAEIEDIRGVTVSKGTLDLLLEIGWVRPRGRRRVPGRPLTYGTTEDFLSHFGLSAVTDLPGLDDLKAQGLLDSQLPPDFKVPLPLAAAGVDEDPLEDPESDEPDLLDEDA